VVLSLNRQLKTGRQGLFVGTRTKSPICHSQFVDFNIHSVIWWAVCVGTLTICHDMHILLASSIPSGGTLVFLVLAVGLALSFEFVNGFHDTANAVATVIYTNTLTATPAVVWSGLWNLIGVLTSSGAVAFGIVALLPVELVINVGSTAGFAMVFALLLSAIFWNVGTWYFGLPASSSHTLIGSILGVGLSNSIMHGGIQAFGSGVNWSKAKEVGMSLLVSPVVGFVCAGLLLLLAKALIKKPALYAAPKGKHTPPLWIRTILVFTCTGVSFAHGSNDGQKGMGLIVLILVGILPGAYALKMNAPPSAVQQVAVTSQGLHEVFERESAGAKPPATDADSTKAISAYLKNDGALSPETYSALEQKSAEIARMLKSATTFNELEEFDRRNMRTDLYLVSMAIKKLNKSGALKDPKVKKAEIDFSTNVDKLTNYIPAWVKYAVALALGLGTMVGYKRIVVTVGEKIGKSHLTYAQGASAELVAMGTILAADHFGLPVSTTHVLSSGIAGTMAANRSGLQMATLRNIALAWVLTLPVCIFLGALLFAFGLNLLLFFGLR
jgi:PiT family inorganic phosphate transporter